MDLIQTSSLSNHPFRMSMPSEEFSLQTLLISAYSIQSCFLLVCRVLNCSVNVFFSFTAILEMLIDFYSSRDPIYSLVSAGYKCLMMKLEASNE